MADAVNLQYQVRQNNEELQDFLKDLYKWEDEVQAKDKLLVNSKASVDSSHPVRNKPRKKKPKSILKQTPASTKPRLKGSDFQAWERYDVDEALKDIDSQEDLQTQSTSDEDSEDEDIIEHRRLQQALFEKEKGNDLFKEGKYEAAINRYTTAIGLDPYNAILPANRAMALIKVQRHGAAIQDCDTALELDSTYIKAYARRATAKQSLGRLQEAQEDYEQLLNFQPGNKQALEGIEKTKKLLAEQAKTSSTKTQRKQGVEIPKKPMKRYVIEEVGSASSDEEEHVYKESQNTLLENKTSLIETLNNLSLPNQAPVNHTSIPIKTVGENTKYSSTIEDHNHLNKPASTDEPDTNKTCEHENNESSGHCREDCADQPASTDNDITTFNLTPPISSIQFQTTWKCLEKNPKQLYKYMKIIPPDQLPKAMGETVESSLLVKMLSIIRDFYVRDHQPIFNELKHISQVKRFSMTLMFFSKKEKSVIKDLFDYLEKPSENEKTFTDSELQTLKKKYGVS